MEVYETLVIFPIFPPVYERVSRECFLRSKEDRDVTNSQHLPVKNVSLRKTRRRSGLGKPQG